MNASNFLAVNGEASVSNVSYAKFGMGVTQFRIVGDLLPGYSYWLKNSQGKDRKFDNLAFNPKTEKWDSGITDVIRERGFTEKNEKGETIPMKSKRNYQVQIINRSTNKVEVMSLSKTMFDAIVAYCRDTNTTDVGSLELFIEKTGDAARWSSIRYNLNQIKTMQLNADPAKVAAAREKDEELLKDIKTIHELFPRPSAEELRQQLDAFLNATAPTQASAPASNDASAQEALSELD